MIYNDGEDVYDDNAADYNTEGPVYSSLAKCSGSCSWVWNPNPCDNSGWNKTQDSCASGCGCSPPDGSGGAGTTGCYN